MYNVSNVLKHRSGPVTDPLNIPHCPSIISVTRVLAAHTPHTAAIILCIYDYEVRTRQHASNVNVKSRMYDDMLLNIMLKWKIWIWNQENCFGKTLAICLSKIMSIKLTVHKASYERMLLQHFLAHQFCWLEYPWVWYNRHFNGISTCRPDLCLLLAYQCLMARRPKQVKLSHKSRDFKINETFCWRGHKLTSRQQGTAASITNNRPA